MFIFFCISFALSVRNPNRANDIPIKTPPIVEVLPETTIYRVINKGWSLCINSYYSILKDSDKQKNAINTMLNLGSFFAKVLSAWFVVLFITFFLVKIRLVKKWLLMKIFSIQSVSLILSLPSVVTHFGFYPTLDLLYISNVSGIFLAYFSRSFVKFIVSNRIMTYYFAKLSDLLIDIAFYFVLFKNIVILACLFSESSYDLFISESTNVEHALLLIGLGWVTVLVQRLDLGAYFDLIANREHMSCIIGFLFTVGFQTPTWQNFWLFILTWFIISQMRRFILTIIYKVLVSMPRYSNKCKLDFAYFFVFLRNLTAALLIPICVITYMQIFDINLLTKIKMFFGVNTYNSFTFISIVTLVFYATTLSLYYSINLYGEKAKAKDFADRHRNIAFAKVMANICFGIVLFIFIYILLYSIDMVPSNTGVVVGLLSTAISWTVGDFIKDVVNGILVLYEGTLKNDDLIYFNDKTAKIEQLFLRCMHIRLDNGILAIVPWHKIDIIQTKSKTFARIIFNISFDIKVSLAKAEESVLEAYSNLKETPLYKYILDDIEKREIADFTAFSYIMQYCIRTEPEWEYRVRRAFNRELLIVFRKNGVSIAMPMVANVNTVPSVTTIAPYPDFR